MLPRPKNQKAAVLKLLITRKTVSERQTNYNGFRSRISELKRELNLRFKVKPFTTEFGTKSSYREHFLPEGQRGKAIRIYHKINAA